MTDDIALRMVAEEQALELASRVDVLSSKIANLEGRVNHFRDQEKNYRAALETIVDLAPKCGWVGGCEAAKVVPKCARCIAKEALGE